MTYSDSGKFGHVLRDGIGIASMDAKTARRIVTCHNLHVDEPDPSATRLAVLDALAFALDALEPDADSDTHEPDPVERDARALHHVRAAMVSLGMLQCAECFEVATDVDPHAGTVPLCGDCEMRASGRC